jgi:predicted amidohydrolase
MRFALLQFSINPDPNKNYQKIENAILQAKENNADVLVTQGMCTFWLSADRNRIS